MCVCVCVCVCVVCLFVLLFYCFEAHWFIDHLLFWILKIWNHLKCSVRENPRHYQGILYMCTFLQKEQCIPWSFVNLSLVLDGTGGNLNREWVQACDASTSGEQFTDWAKFHSISQHSSHLLLRSFMMDSLSYLSFQPVLHDWCNKGRGMWLSFLFDDAYKKRPCC